MVVWVHAHACVDTCVWSGLLLLECQGREGGGEMEWLALVEMPGWKGRRGDGLACSCWHVGMLPNVDAGSLFMLACSWRSWHAPKCLFGLSRGASSTLRPPSCLQLMHHSFPQSVHYSFPQSVHHSSPHSAHHSSLQPVRHSPKPGCFSVHQPSCLRHHLSRMDSSGCADR